MPLITSSSVEVGTWEAFRALAARMIDDQQAAADHADVSCHRGCVACCNQPVPVGPAELARIVEGVDALDPATRQRIRAQIATAARSLRRAGFAADDLVHLDPSGRRDYANRYFHHGVPCPLLDGETCAVRNERPLVCRDYLVTSDPVHCSTFDVEQVVRIRRTDDALGNFRKAESAAGVQAPAVLALALDEPVETTVAFERRSVVESVGLLRG